MSPLIPIGFLLLGVLAATQTAAQAVSCTVSTYNADNIEAATKQCKDITLNGLQVPAGVTLALNLQPGTRLTFDGTTTWGYAEWNGPLVNITGTDIEILGTEKHLLDARGALWWDGKGEHGGTIKPLFFVLHGVKNGVIRNVNTINTPYHAFWIEESDGVLVSWLVISSQDGDVQGGHNTDGFNVWKSNNVTLEHTIVYNQDDCVAIKSGTNILVNDFYCYGGHGLSIGSVGGRDYNIVENVTVEKVLIEESDNGVRIKTVYGATGSVRNVTYKQIELRGINKYGIIIEGDYDINTGSPTGNATDGVPIEHFILEDIKGTVKKSGQNIYVLVKNASDWSWSDIEVTGGEAHEKCEGIPDGTGYSC